MTNEQRNKCHAIIHFTSTLTASVGAGLAQLPASDNVFIIPLQVTMIISLGVVFGISLSKSTAKSALATTTATYVGRGISQILLGWIPIWGNAINASTAAAITEIIGWAIVYEFDKK